ncbi:MAG: hypothetical protein PGN11_18975 [Quadrisphaera sp.]
MSTTTMPTAARTASAETTTTAQRAQEVSEAPAACSAAACSSSTCCSCSTNWPTMPMSARVACSRSEVVVRSPAAAASRTGGRVTVQASRVCPTVATVTRSAAGPVAR